MERMLEYLLIEIPEVMLLLLIAMSIFNINALKNKREVAIFTVLLSAWGALLSELSVSYEMRLASCYIVANALVCFLYRLRIMTSMGILAVSFIAQIISESITLSIFNIFQIYFEAMMLNVYTRYLAAAIYLSIMLGIVVLFRITRFDARRIFPCKQKDQYLTTLIIFMSIELLLILFLNANYFLGQDNEAITLFKEDNQSFIFSMILVIFLAISVNFYAYLKSSILHAQIETEAPYIKNLNEFVIKLKSVKHDAINHISVIQQLIREQEIDSAYEYAEQVVNEINETVHMVKEVKNLPVSAILQSKKEICKFKGIEFQLSVVSKWQLKHVKTNDLVTILGNLLDNAIEACENQIEKKAVISFDWNESTFNEQIVIENTGCVNLSNLDKIFELGVTTKHKGGTGLAVVKQLVDKYKANIKLASKNGKVKVSLMFPKPDLKSH